VLCFNARRSLLYLLPVLLVTIFSAAVFVDFWHAGLLVPLVIALLWITWPAASDSNKIRYETIGRTALLFLVGTQILWSAHAVAYDHYHAYSPDLATANFLRPFVKDGATIAVTSVNMAHVQAYDDVGISPYFDHNIYINQPYSFWWWSKNNPTEHLFDVALRSHHPRIVLVETLQGSSNQPINLNFPKIKLLTDSGYSLTNVFCGAKPARLELKPRRMCHLIFQYSGSRQNPSAKPKD
jgi:hypothetical protein